ncbi:MAG: nitrophenyl compound nitroreductase subunit ArsF family protein [Bacteroidota bacterium]
MKQVKFLTILLLSLGMNISCSSQTNKKESSPRDSESGKVDVYYFHYTRRCATCNTVENVSKEAVAELYGGKVNFTEYNLDEEEGKSRGEEIGVSGQTLIIVAGDTKINITNEGFMNARSNPEKLKQIIKDKIDPLIN